MQRFIEPIDPKEYLIEFGKYKEEKGDFRIKFFRTNNQSFSDIMYCEIIKDNKRTIIYKLALYISPMLYSLECLNGRLEEESYRFSIERNDCELIASVEYSGNFSIYDKYKYLLVYSLRKLLKDIKLNDIEEVIQNLDNKELNLNFSKGDI